MEDNPYVKIIGTMRKDRDELTTASYRTGYVRSTAPLTVEVEGLMQGAEALKKNAALGALEINDELLLLPIDDEQSYIILCKVVSI